MLKYIFNVVLAALALGTSALAWADDTSQILDKMALAYDSQLPVAMRITSSTISFSRGEGAMLRLFKSPDRFRSKIIYASGSEVRTTVGAMAWNQDKPANPAQRSAVALQAARIALPWNVLTQRAQVNDMGRSDIDGKAVQTLEFTLEPTLKMLLQVDLESGHTYAAREEHYAMGQRIGHSHIQNVEFLDALPDSAFAPWTMVQSSPDTADRVRLALR